ncbi:MAG: hypothetical protein ACI8PB_005462 [Desulforhopalus sp.]|jgi:hypothetical protein
MRTLLFLIIITVFWGLEISCRPAYAGSPNVEKGVLDGMVFVGHVGPKGGDANGEDEVVFQDGQFLSTSCSKYGFGSAPYTVSRKGNGIIFTAVTLSPKNGQIYWKGKVVGEKVVATYIWKKERWYWFDANEESWLKAQLIKE